MTFQEKYKDRMSTATVSLYSITNEQNNLEIILKDESVILNSNGKIDLNDLELNEFLVSYKKLRDEKILSIKVCENINRYDY